MTSTQFDFLPCFLIDENPGLLERKKFMKPKSQHRRNCHSDQNDPRVLLVELLIFRDRFKNKFSQNESRKSNDCYEESKSSPNDHKLVCVKFIVFQQNVEHIHRQKMGWKSQTELSLQFQENRQAERLLAVDCAACWAALFSWVMPVGPSTLARARVRRRFASEKKGIAPGYRSCSSSCFAKGCHGQAG